MTLVDRLPKTRSGKILRDTMRSIADGESYRVPPTIDDPAILPEVEAAVQTIGYGKSRTSPERLRLPYRQAAGRCQEGCSGRCR